MGAFLTYALDVSNMLVHVDNVPNGIKCDCRCPHCNSPLYAKNGGQERTHHFAHAHGQECKGAYESSLHLLAKEVLQETGELMFPPSSNPNLPSGLTKVFDIKTEIYDNLYHIKPDLEGVLSNGERIFIEFLVSHKIDNKKRKTIVDNKLNCIEIDINYQALDKNELIDFLTKSSEDRRWITSTPPPPNGSDSYSYGRNPIYAKTRDILKEIFDEKTLIIHPHQYSLTKPNRAFDLRKYGYDVCEVNTQYRGFKSDLLLFRSYSENKDYISINIRGRRRTEGYKRPKELRVIDIILNYDSDKDLKKRWESGNLTNDSWSTTIYYYGFKD